MKVSFKLNLGAYSGKYRNVVYRQYFNYRLCHTRIFTYPKITEQNLRLKAINANINVLYQQMSDGYRDDLRRYATLNKMENQSRSPALRKQMPGAKAVFVKCLWAWAKSAAEAIDLSTITIAEMLAMAAPLCRIKDCVEAGYLRKVSNWESLDKLIG